MRGAHPLDHRVRRARGRGDVLTLTVEASEAFVAAARRWGDDRLTDPADAFERKTEQALLEIEHLVSGATEVEFAVDGRVIHYEPSEELAGFLAERAERTGLEESAILKLYVDLFAGAFLEEGLASIDDAG